MNCPNSYFEADIFIVNFIRFDTKAYPFGIDILVRGGEKNE
jgi:hypothetical protein